MTHFNAKKFREKTFPRDIVKRTSEIIEVPASNERHDVTFKKIKEK